MLSEFPEQIRAKRVELLVLSIFPHKLLSEWITAPLFSMCRYDFIPELVMQTKLTPTSVLFNASMKNKLSHGFYQFNLKQFDIVFCSSSEDYLKIKKLGVKNCETFDFRSKRILSRQIEFSRDNKNLPLIENLKKIRKRKIIIGSCWPEDLVVIKETLTRLDIKVFIFPHNLDPSTISKHESILPVDLVVSDILDSSFIEAINNEDFNVFLITQKGVLCDLYYYFEDAYIGGGFGKHVHSLLEPFIGGSRVFFGPKNHKSTELDFIKGIDKNKVIEIQKNQDFFTFFKEISFSREESKVELSNFEFRQYIDGIQNG